MASNPTLSAVVGIPNGDRRQLPAGVIVNTWQIRVPGARAVAARRDANGRAAGRIRTCCMPSLCELYLPRY